MATKDSYLVIGGCGFLGKHIVNALLERGDLEVAVFDLVQRELDPRVRFFSGDITDQAVLDDAIRKSNTTCVIHTASPVVGLKAPIYWKVNVEGTKTVIESCVANGVKKLVYTSSAGVVYDGGDLIDADERLPYPDTPLDAYNETKAKAEELVLMANGREGLKTVALRPAGIFGPGDRQVMHHMANVITTNKTHFQIGDNTNLFDWTYVGNVAYAHLLAADKLSTITSPLSKDSITAVPLPPIEVTTGSRRIPTSAARPMGPAVYKTAENEKRQLAFSDPETEKSSPQILVLRSRYDQLSDIALEAEDVSPLQVAGQAFFITNGEPMYFWDFPRSVWRALGHVSERRKIVLGRSIGLALAGAAEWFNWALGREGNFTRYRVIYTCSTRWYNIEKARRVLGYEPQVGVQEGIGRMVQWWKETGSKSNERH